MTKDFILASQSPQRRELLERIGFAPKQIIPADIDESEKKGEKPSAYVKRMALEKALRVAQKNPNQVVLACDTVVVAPGNKVLHKAQNEEEQLKVMKCLSGRTHRVLSAVCVVDKNGKVAVRLNDNKVYMKRLSDEEIKDYVASEEWVGCSGYKIEGCLEAYVEKFIGSYSGIVGLPLFETRNLLVGAGVKDAY